MNRASPLPEPNAGNAPDASGGDARRASRMGDIAKAAGVSVSTVSRALRGTAGVGPDLKRKIATLAAAMDYDGRGSTAAGLQMQVFSLVSMDLFASDAAGFYREIIEAIELEMDAEGVPVSVVFLERDADNVERIRELCDTPQPVGLLLMGLDDEDLLHAAAAAGEIVLVNGSDPRMRHDGVTPANKRGAYLATEHLINLGHRRIAHFTSLRRSTIRDRLEGYKLALTDYGIAFDEGLVFDLPDLKADDAVSAARSAVAAGRLDASAILCGNDMVAVGVVSALTKAGRKVPDDFSVVGFDNTRVTAKHRPSLTTVAVDMMEVGRQSARRLIARMKSPHLPALDIRVGCRLLERDSTRPLVNAEASA